MPQQQATIGPALIEGVERTDAVIVHPQQRVGVVQRNTYAMNIDRGRNCYACREFGHMAQHCRNRGTGNRIGEGRRLEYGSRENNGQRRIEERNEANNLKGEEDLIVFDYIPVIISLQCLQE